MTHKQLWRLSAAVFIVFLFLAGCAHRPVKTPSSEGTPAQKSPAKKIVEQKAEPGAGGKRAEDNFFEDEFDEEKLKIADPIAPWNRAMFQLNDKLYFCVLKPLAVAYKELTPAAFRTCVKNFFYNITAPVRFVNCILQGKGKAAEAEAARFVMNTTLGLLGLVNAAENHPGMVIADEEDLGQTLAGYGIGNGFYIVWPLFGPSTLRDSLGRVGDYFMNPVSYVDTGKAWLGIKTLELTNETTYRLGEYEALKKAAIDPYLAFRDIYIQYRDKKLEK